MKLSLKKSENRQWQRDYTHEVSTSLLKQGLSNMHMRDRRMYKMDKRKESEWEKDVTIISKIKNCYFRN